MKILFLSIGMPDLSTTQGGLYSDMLRELAKHNHQVTVIAPSIEDAPDGLHEEGEIRVLRIPLGQFRGNIPFYKKGFRILNMSRKYKGAYKKYFRDERFDVLLMATPPVTLVDVAEVVKKYSGAKMYLILRDIHPQCMDRKIVPQEILDRTDVYDECKKPYRVNFFVEKFLYHKAQQLYKISDFVGCMSPQNQSYFKTIAPYVDDSRILLLPNWYRETEPTEGKNLEVLKKYHLEGKYIAVFGGTIGPAQAIWNIASLAKHNLDKKDVVFLVVGRGWKKATLEKIAKQDGLTNMVFMEFMPKSDYETLLENVDVGLVSIDEKYPVPTCPSKIIGYMALKKPVVAMFNAGNDYGEFYIDKPGCGLWSVGLDNEKMFANFDWLYSHPEERRAMGEAGYNYFKTHLTAKAVCDMLCEQLETIKLL